MSMESKKGKKIYVGMSGGVDSSVSASLLKAQGYDVTGIFIRVWQPDFIECTQRADREDAMRVAASLEIPFKTLDLEKEYKERVVDYMIAEYKEGRTPNPDIMCNHYVKFGGFFEWAMNDGADLIATGHYAQTDGEGRLFQALDKGKDQTYFLWKLTADKLTRILFPVGGIMKNDVRKYAQDNGIHVAGKKDSVGVCFIGEMDMKEFLSNFFDLKPGNVLNTKGDVVGQHSGAELYTVGQRRGFEVIKKAPDEGAHFIISKDIQANTITVVSERDRAKEEPLVKKVQLKDVNWISGEFPVDAKEVQIRFRHRQPLIESVLTSANSITVEFTKFQRSVNMGQSLVMYDGERCLGGGIINKVITENLSGDVEREK